MPHAKDTPFHRLLATKYAEDREEEAIGILDGHPDIAQLEWPGPDSEGQPFVKGSTALHYAANDGKLRLVRRLIDCGADVNASNACWFSIRAFLGGEQRTTRNNRGSTRTWSAARLT